MTTPFDLYQEQLEKEAFDPGAIAHGLQALPGMLQHGLQAAHSFIGHGPVIDTALHAAGGHVALNAAIKMKDKFLPQIGRMGNKKGIIHGLTGRTMRPGLHEAGSLMLGRDAMGLDYDAGKALAQKVMGHPSIDGDARKALAAMQQGASNPIVKELAGSNHALGNIHEAIKSVKPEDLTNGPSFGGLFSTRQSNVTPGKDKLVRRAVGIGGNAAAIAAGVLTGNHNFFHVPTISAVNAARGAMGTSNAGKLWTGTELVKGLAGKARSKVGDVATTLALSPSAAEVRHIGQTIGSTAKRYGQDAGSVINQVRHGGSGVGDVVSDFLSQQIGLGQGAAQQVGGYAQGFADFKNEAPHVAKTLKGLMPQQPTRRLPSIADRKLTPGMAAMGAAGIGAGVAAPVLMDAARSQPQKMTTQDEEFHKAASIMTYDLLEKYAELGKRQRFHQARKFERDLMLELGQMDPDEHARQEAKMASDLAEARAAIDEYERTEYGTKQADTIFLGGKVSGKDGNWREEIKSDLRDAGHKVIDPKKPANEWDPAVDIYQEIKQILGADHVFFHKGGFFTKKEKQVCDVAGKDYTVVKDPKEIVEKMATDYAARLERMRERRQDPPGSPMHEFMSGNYLTTEEVLAAYRRMQDRQLSEKLAYNATVPVDMVGTLTRTPSAFPEDSRGRILTTLRAAQSGDTVGLSLARYLRNHALSNASPHELSVLMSLVHVSR